MKIRLISGLRDPEAKLKPVDSIKFKPTMTFSKMTESLQFRSRAMAIASSKKWDTTSKRPSKNRVKFSLVVKAIVIFVIDVEVSHTVASRNRL